MIGTHPRSPSARLLPAGLLAVLGFSCAPPPETPDRSAEKPAPAAPAPASALRARAEELWRARHEEDWATVCRFHPARSTSTEEAFATWSEANEPFRYPSYHLEDVAIDGELGWVHVACRTEMRRFPGTPPQEVRRWEKWRIEEGRWYPVPLPEVDAYPEAPARRDLGQEPRLRARFEASWQARRDADWPALYAMVDPADHAELSEEKFSGTLALIAFLDREVHWIEVLGPRGFVRVTYVEKLTDPSLTKLPPRDTVLSEEWVLRDGEWYRDLVIKAP